MKAAAIKIFGRVQGVGFRYYTEREARKLGIAGFVQNKPDGSVYVEAEGDEAAMELFLKWCRTGPPWAKVREIVVSELPPLGRMGFVIK